MSWIKHREEHYCDIPVASSATKGDLWRCDECGVIWRRTSAHPDHELTQRFAVWRRASIRTWRAKRREKQAQRVPAWRNVSYDVIEPEPPVLLHPEQARPSGGLPIVRESDLQ